MTINTNVCYLQRSPDNQNWTTLQEIDTTTAGVTMDTCFDQPGPGSWFYRIYAQDNNGNPLGATSLLGVVLNR